jgi:hypothetical protein
MASTYAKRLQRLEEQMAARINKPLAYIWVDAGETRDEAIAKAGYDPSQADRITTIRWMTSAEAASAPPKPWDVPDPGPLPDEPQQEASPPPDEPTAVPYVDEHAEKRYREAIARREAEIITEKLFDDRRRFAKTIA